MLVDRPPSGLAAPGVGLTYSVSVSLPAWCCTRTTSKVSTPALALMPDTAGLLNAPTSPTMNWPPL